MDGRRWRLLGVLGTSVRVLFADRLDAERRPAGEHRHFYPFLPPLEMTRGVLELAAEARQTGGAQKTDPELFIVRRRHRLR